MIALDAAAVVLVVVGCAFVTAGTLGLLRFRDLDSRLHALAKADVLGLGFVVAGLALHAADLGVAAKLVLVWLLAALAAAANSHLLATRAGR